MAAMIKHRKLFPALTEINQTTDCSDIYYNCDTELYFPPPPPSTSPLSDADHHITPFTIAIICILSSIFLLVSYYVIIAKSCTGWCGLRTRTTTIAAAAESPPRAAQSDGGREEEEFLEENRTDHPIWFITTVGLQQSIINSITICKYKKNDGLIEGTECSVCLNEFQEEETLRLLPKCSHAFHIPCIDTWLRSHTNCPLCRAHIVSAEGVVSSGSSNGESEMGSSEINLELNRGERETGDGEDSILMTDSSSSGNVNSGDSSSEPVLVEPEGSSKMSSKSN